MNLFWLKLSANFDKDDRIFYVENQKNGEVAIWCYIKLLCIAARSNMGGAVYLAEGIPHTVKTLSDQWHRHLALTQKTLQLLEKARLIDVENGVIYISDWDIVQNTSKLEEIREYERERKRKYREMRKAKCLGQVPNCPNTEIEKETEKEIEKEKELEEDDIYESVKDQFNMITAIPKIISLSDKQKTAIRCAVDKFGEELLYECFRMAGESEFLKGKNPKNWVATFDWLINPDNISKVLNGNYSAVYGETPIDDGLEKSFESHEFIEAALTRGFS